MKPLLFLSAALAFACVVPAGEPFLKPNDVIALVGGEDMVAASEYGYLELLLVRALPEHHLRFRNLAWEGDTVFEQRRDLNFPPLEDQLEKVGATVVIAQFGQMESLAGKENLPEFIAAYEKLIERMSGGAKRRIVLLGPGELEASKPGDSESIEPQKRNRAAYAEAIRNLASHSDDVMEVSPGYPPVPVIPEWVMLPEDTLLSATVRLDALKRYRLPESASQSARTRDGFHANYYGQLCVAEAIGWKTTNSVPVAMLSRIPVRYESLRSHFLEEIRQLIIAKNLLWSRYWRPQNWAFLAGDRTNQPSSRDHLDPSKRWFPDEIEQFIPLLEAKEREIDALAAWRAKP